MQIPIGRRLYYNGLTDLFAFSFFYVSHTLTFLPWRVSAVSPRGVCFGRSSSSSSASSKGKKKAAPAAKEKKAKKTKALQRASSSQIQAQLKTVKHIKARRCSSCRPPPSRRCQSEP